MYIDSTYLLTALYKSCHHSYFIVKKVTKILIVLVLHEIGIMGDHIHMKFAKTLMTILGIWPVKLTGWKMILYNTYFYTSYVYYILYDISQGAMVFIEKGDFLETAGNLGVLIVYVINIYKVYLCRSVAIRDIIREIEIKESLILKSNDEMIKKIYYSHVNSALLSARYYVCLGSVGISLYFISPIVNNLIEKTTENKYLIFNSWFPFDSDKHYVYAYLIQFFGGFYGYAYIVYAGAFFFGILTYCVGQIKILQHTFRNINKYIAQRARKDDGLTQKQSQEMFVKLCIREHQHIIRLVERLDNCIKTFMLLEFLTSSFQLSLVVYQILQSSGFGIERVKVIDYLITLCSQLFIFYWNAHTIIIESTGLAQAIFESDWYTLNKEAKEMLLFVMRRAQKPIGISIGPIYKVKVDALIGIFKAIYSYVAIIQK
ncbi:hypothetical protein NQ315_013338 [Exocentrus adspersus]|uniref:Odorant receptor n=1 Tax=Exocentrus adspersus TaxID=1586481 RepID=A0AAV8V6W7_9CUCU|nr:hypothetical protein NQ315_013338 [Exocentrus adspersus]